MKQRLQRIYLKVKYVILVNKKECEQGEACFCIYDCTMYDIGSLQGSKSLPNENTCKNWESLYHRDFEKELEEQLLLSGLNRR